MAAITVASSRSSSVTCSITTLTTYSSLASFHPVSRCTCRREGGGVRETTAGKGAWCEVHGHGAGVLRGTLSLEPLTLIRLRSGYEWAEHGVFIGYE